MSIKIIPHYPEIKAGDVATAAVTGAVVGATVPAIKNFVAGKLQSSRVEGFVKNKAKDSVSLFKKIKDGIKNFFTSKSSADTAKTATKEAGKAKKVYNAAKESIKKAAKTVSEKAAKAKNTIAENVSKATKTISEKTSPFTKIFKNPTVKWAAIGALVATAAFIGYKKLQQWVSEKTLCECFPDCEIMED